VIATKSEYEKAQSELQDLQARLERLQREHPLGENGFTKAGIRKLIARLNEELALFEGSEEARSSPSE
jgi:predicted nuclease with TOPRIM domain